MHARVKKLPDSLANFLLVLVLPLGIWMTLLDHWSQAKGWQLTTFGYRAAAAALLGMSLFGVFRATGKWPLGLRLFAGACWLPVLLFLFVLWAFAVALSSATFMP